ncbi:Apoptotic protease-activating factor 1 [Heracleum sosnowskyi]|uniref:Apoptotic protease-activating factor 1 n=1 Tax=Heracleum sosnowskyi TaxID=360622 RepID=A0AAD8LWN4_9APIA|nr:Apoptotic protease-activating factor 1 [Heracleum sosnowskyi]
MECGATGSTEPSSTQVSDEAWDHLHHDIAQLTRLQSEPHKLLSRRLPGLSTLPISPVEMLARREANFSGRGRFSPADSCHVLSRYLPENGPSVIDKMDSSGYVSQFSPDGSLFVAGFQESHIRIYNVDRGWKVQKDIRARSLRWTITDVSLSPNKSFLVYASLSPIIHIVNIASSTTESVANVTEIHDGLDLSAGNDNDYGHQACNIFSVKFSTDGRELIAASSDASIYVYDLGANRISIRFPAHRSDVNTVCFADESGHIMYSGSDDGLCKVWDRRCLIKNEQASGVLVGHLEGVTFIDSRGDGRHLISNGKDQTIKLWDIRKMSSNLTQNPYERSSQWDYRCMEYPDHLKNICHPSDISLATFKGHAVLRTLIRCYFSPANSTGQKYIYTGSADNSVYIYDLLSGAEVAKLSYHDGPVRDCSWHPDFPTLVSSSWDGVIAKWDFSDSSQNQGTDSCVIL